MATPTPQAVASNDNGNANTTTGSVVCPTVLDGDGIALVVTSSRGSGGLAGNAPSLPSGSLTVRGGGASGDTTASGTCTTQVWTRDNLVAATDSGATISLAFLSGRYSVAVLTYRGGSFDQCTAVNQTGTGANPADAGITPGAADCLRMILSGYDPASGVSTTLTPPASPGTWTEQIEHENTASTTFRPGGYIATTPLTGQNGTPQSAATITASTKPNANTYALTIKPSGATNVNADVAIPLTDTVTSAAQIGVAAGAAIALTAAITASLVIGTSSGASVNETATIASAAQVGVSSGATVPLTATISSSLSVGGSAVSIASTVPLADTIASTAVVGVSSGAALSETATVTSAAVVGKQTGASLAETVTVASTAQVGKATGASIAPVFAVTATGVVGVQTGASVGVTFAVTSAISVQSGGPTIPYIELIIPARLGTLEMPEADRTLAIGATLRTLALPDVDRTLVIPAATRTLEIPEV